MELDMKVIGQRVRTARKAAGLTVEKLAERIGVANESLAHIECGARKPSLALLITIANELDVSMDYLTGRIPAETRNLINELAHTEELTPDQRQTFLDMAHAIIPVTRKRI